MKDELNTYKLDAQSLPRIIAALVYADRKKALWR